MGEIIPQEAYRFVYFFISLVLVFVKTDKERILSPEPVMQSYNKALILGIFFIIFFGTRPTSGLWMADTGGYAYVYNHTQSGIISPNIDWSAPHEIIWNVIYNNMALTGFPVWAWFTVVAAIYIIANIAGIKRIFPEHTYLVFLLYTAFFLFYSGGINGIRNADAYSLVFFAMSLYYSPSFKKYLMMALLCLVAYQIHTSVIVTILSFIISIFLVKKTNLAIAIWFGSIVMSLVAGNYLADYAAGLIDDGRAAKYLRYGQDADMMATAFSHSGFRWDFLLFSILPIALGWYASVKRGIHDRFYQVLLNTYIIANAVWIVFMYAAFSNRFAMLSWCIYPYVLCYPLLKFKLWNTYKQNQYMCAFLWIMLLFSGYMNVFI